MKNIAFVLLMIFAINMISPRATNAETSVDDYMYDFYSQSNEARKILKEIENTLKDGSRHEVCIKQKKAARLGLLANESLIKAFESGGNNPPIKVIIASQKRWESLLNEC